MTAQLTKTQKALTGVNAFITDFGICSFITGKVCTKLNLNEGKKFYAATALKTAAFAADVFLSVIFPIALFIEGGFAALKFIANVIFSSKKTENYPTINAVVKFFRATLVAKRPPSSDA